MSQKTVTVSKTEETEPKRAEKSKVVESGYWERVWTYDNYCLLFFVLCVILFNSTYQKLMYMAYSTEFWHCFDHFCKVMMNHFGHYGVKRSLLRNLVLNTIRLMPEELLFYCLYGDVTPWSTIAFRLLNIWGFTVLV